MCSRYLFAVLFFGFLIGTHPLAAQDTLPRPDKVAEIDTIQPRPRFFKRFVNYFKEAKKDKSQDKFDISFIGGPSYSVTTKLGIGALASGLYRLDRQDTTIPPSDISLYSSISTSGFFVLGVTNNTIFPKDKYRINSELNFVFMPTRYYGIGYEAGNTGEFTEFDEYRLHFKSSFLKKLAENFFAGLTIDAKNINGKHFEDEGHMPQGKLNNYQIGGGYVLSYDSRDFIPNPSKGIYGSFEQNFYPKALGSTTRFNEITITFDTYKRIMKNTILAFDLNGDFNNGDVPWSMLSLLGSTRQMRGYYVGQYRDKHQINTQLEWRQKVYHRHGFVVWGGAGNVFHSFKSWDWGHILPTYGLGYRWEFKHNVNIRFDYGIGKGQKGFSFNVNEAF